MTTTPQAVSATIRRAGEIIPVPRNREGTHVTRGYGGTVSISLDYDTTATVEAAKTHITEILTSAGYDVWATGSGRTLRVSRAS